METLHYLCNFSVTLKLFFEKLCIYIYVDIRSYDGVSLSIALLSARNAWGH